MKLSKREMILVGVLGILVISASAFKFLLMPQLKDIERLKTEVEKYRVEVERVKIETAENSPLKKEYKLLNAKSKVISERLFPSITQEKFIYLLDDFLTKSNLRGDSLSFAETSVKKVEFEQSLKANKNYPLRALKDRFNDVKEKPENIEDIKADNAKDNSDSTEKMTVTLNYTGKYANLVGFIGLIDSYGKKIIINNLTVENGNVSNSTTTSNTNTSTIVLEKDTVKGSITLEFYSVPKLYEGDEDYLQWEYKGGYGKSDPFTEIKGYTSVEKSNTTYNTDINDFEMIVHPLSSDLPTIQIGRSKDKSGKTNIFADNGNFEDVQLEIIQEGDKYYYKYRTSQESYPQNYDSDKMEFKPNGLDVNLYISSAKRNNSEDNSGVNLSLLNKSNLRLNVKISYDDDKKPRIKMIKKTGNVFITK